MDEPGEAVEPPGDRNDAPPMGIGASWTRDRELLQEKIDDFRLDKTPGVPVEWYRRAGHSGTDLL
jgi:hypothetical protein